MTTDPKSARSEKEDWEYRLELEGNPVFTRVRLALEAQVQRTETAERELADCKAERDELRAAHDLGWAHKKCPVCDADMMTGSRLATHAEREGAELTQQEHIAMSIETVGKAFQAAQQQNDKLRDAAPSPAPDSQAEPVCEHEWISPSPSAKYKTEHCRKCWAPRPDFQAEGFDEWWDSLTTVSANIHIMARSGWMAALRSQPAPSAASGLAERAIPFWQKHAMGSKLCPSCFACGNAEPDSSRWAIKHLELPDIYICATCMDRLRSHQAPVGEEDDRPDIPTLEQAREELAGISDSEWANYLEGLVRAHERRARSPQTGGGSNG